MKKIFAVCVMLINLLVSAQEVGMENRKCDEVVVKNRNQVEFEKALTDLVDGSDSDPYERILHLRLHLNQGAHSNVRDAAGLTPLARVIQATGNKISPECALTLVKILAASGASVVAMQDPETGMVLFEENLWKVMGKKQLDNMHSLHFALNTMSTARLKDDSSAWVGIYDNDDSYKKATCAKDIITILRQIEQQDKEDIAKLLEDESIKDIATIIVAFLGRNDMPHVELFNGYYMRGL